jgi:hypothetical protein
MIELKSLRAYLIELESKLEQEKKKVEEYEKSVTDESRKTLVLTINEFFNSQVRRSTSSYEFNVLLHYESLKAYVLDKENPKQDAFSSDGVTVQYRRSYSSYEDDASFNDYVEINWYGSSAGCKDTNKLKYLEMAGDISLSLVAIEEEYKSMWMPKYKEIINYLKKYSEEFYSIQNEIIEVKSKINQLELDQFSVPGFECTINTYKKHKRNYHVDSWDCLEAYELVDEPYSITLQTGRSKYDRIDVNYFKFVGPAKRNKVDLLVTTSLHNKESHPVQVSKQTYEDFAKQVHYWQNEDSIKKSKYESERYERHVKEYSSKK